MTDFLNRRQLVTRAAQTLGVSALGVTAPPFRHLFAQDDATTPFILLVHCSGGWDQTMVFDPKLGGSHIAQEAGATLAKGAGKFPYVSHADRPEVRAFFSNYGANAVAINGLYSGSMVRENALQSMLGKVPSKYNRPVDWLTFYAYCLNPGLAIPHAVIAAPYMPGEFSSASVNITERYLTHVGQDIPATVSIKSAGEKGLSTFRSKVFERAIKRSPAKSIDNEKVAAIANSYTRMSEVDKALAAALTEVGPQGTDADFLYHGKLAIELFASGKAQCVTLQAGATDEWNTETDHFNRQSVLFNSLFTNLNLIMTEATTKAVFGKLVVIVMSERGRAPELNDADGKGAWPYTSALLWGSGLNGGKVFGETDSTLRGRKINPLFGEATGGADDVLLEMGNVMSAIYLKNGVPYKLMAPDQDPLAVILQG